ncbi:30S ribosomal protein S16 [Parachryseolinea silvisoli]|uniref:30S ribosomal protein S16 n=1 Tax=Parachryseolinea silvisoli TaxID=2873601 RepID=UPI002265B846|nr:30S ribosomal protein S16 [Parachryseolinea silvisoli]MCD9015368.1 30S ribosomal protein S16 [Parachryseolinea silvisoli]
MELSSIGREHYDYTMRFHRYRDYKWNGNAPKLVILLLDTKAPKSARVADEIGFYDPEVQTISLFKSRVNHWLDTGATINSDSSKISAAWEASKKILVNERNLLVHDENLNKQIQIVTEGGHEQEFIYNSLNRALDNFKESLSTKLVKDYLLATCGPDSQNDVPFWIVEEAFAHHRKRKYFHDLSSVNLAWEVVNRDAPKTYTSDETITVALLPDRESKNIDKNETKLIGEDVSTAYIYTYFSLLKSDTRQVDETLRRYYDLLMQGVVDVKEDRGLARMLRLGLRGYLSGEMRGEKKMATIEMRFMGIVDTVGENKVFVRAFNPDNFDEEEKRFALSKAELLKKQVDPREGVWLDLTVAFENGKPLDMKVAPLSEKDIAFADSKTKISVKLSDLLKNG